MRSEVLRYGGLKGIIFPDPSPPNFTSPTSQMMLHPCLIKNNNKNSDDRPLLKTKNKPKKVFVFFFLKKTFFQGEVNRSLLLLQVQRLSPSVRSKDRNSRLLVVSFDGKKMRLLLPLQVKKSYFL